MHPKKHFGQHFLHDKHIIQQIIHAINPTLDEKFVEIGPGRGALTLPMLKKIGALDVIEIDRDVIPELQHHCHNYHKLIIHQMDALEFDFATLIKLPEKLRVFGNLPYNISTPLIFHLLSFTNIIQDMHFMLQKEVVDRLAAEPHTEHYGRLSVMVQYHARVTHLFDVPPQAFHPSPKVYSSIVRLIPYTSLPYVANNYEKFATIVRLAFSQRRKTLRNCLKTLITDEMWQQAEIDPIRRGEELSVAEYVKISNLPNKI